MSLAEISSDNIKSRTFLVIPAYNEATVLPDVLRGLFGLGWKNIVLVDDGSQDNTIASLSEFTDLHILRHEINRGPGAATQTGLTYALQSGGDYFVLLDGDGQHSSTEINNLLGPVVQGQCDITIGTRFAANSKVVNMPLTKKIILRLGTYFTWLVSGVLISDPHNGFKCLNRKAAQKMKFTFDRFEFCSEIIDIVKKERLRILEVPSTVTYTDYSIEKGQRAMNSLAIGYNMLIYKLTKILFN